MECLACHTPNIDGARFCAKCGAPLPVQKSPDADPLIGKTVGGRYRITGILGEGGMGRVYDAEQQMGTSVRKVAVKTLLAQFAKDPQTVARFMREVGTVSELEHPNTIKVYDFGQIEDSGELYIAMELLQGQSLDDVVSAGRPIPAERVDRILGQVCGSLQEAHDKGIVHRDLKPANIFLTTRAGEEDVVKVLDFGIAKRDSKDSKQEQKLTQQGTILGTPPYMSPEQFTGQELDARSDIYSLGVVTYEMLTGRLPFEADTPWAWMTQHMQATPYPFDGVPAASSIPGKMRDAVLRALAKDKAHRPQSAREFFEELTLGSTRMSAVGLGAGGVGSMPTPMPTGGSGTQAIAMGAARPGGTQIGEPLIPDAGYSGPMPHGGSAKTMIGDPTGNMGGMGGYGAPPMAGAAYAQAAPASGKKSGGGAVIGAALGFLLLGGAGAAGYYFYSQSKTNATAETEAETIAIPTKSATASAAGTETSAPPKPSETATAPSSTASAPVPSAEPTATATTTTTSAPPPTATTTTTTKPTATATATGSRQGFDACCAKYRSNKSKFQTCSSLSSGVKAGRLDRNAILNTLRSQGMNCQ